MKEWDAIVIETSSRKKLYEDGLPHAAKSLETLSRTVIDALSQTEPPPKDLEQPDQDRDEREERGLKERTDPIQGGRVHAWQKIQGDRSAFMPIEPGIYLGSPLDAPEQTLGEISFLDADETEARKKETALARRRFRTSIRFSFSELIRDLELLTV